MGIRTKMLGTKTFLLLSLSVLGYSVPQPELRIHIHLHQDDFQPGPARGPTSNIGTLPFPGGYPGGRPAIGETDYTDYGDYGDYVSGQWEKGRCVTRSGKEIPMTQSKDYTKKDVTRRECRSICNKYPKKAKGCGFIQYNKGNKAGQCTLFLVKVKNSRKNPKGHYKESCISY